MEHVFTIGGKNRDIFKEDLETLAKDHGIRRHKAIIEEVAAVTGRFRENADKTGVTQPYKGLIAKRLDDILTGFGIRAKAQRKTITDHHGRRISDFQISINSTGTFVVTALIDGKRFKKFIRKKMKGYEELRKTDIYNLSDKAVLDLVASLMDGIED